MRKNRSFLFAAFIVSIFICTTILNAFAITIDGKDGRNEWSGSSVFCIIGDGDQSNCDVTYATIRSYADDAENRLYLALNCKINENAADIEPFGAELFINGGDRIAVFYDSGSNVYDPYYYSLESSFKYDEITRVFCGEVCIGIKFGIPDTLSLGVRFFDCGGIPSNYYTVSIRSSGDEQDCGDEDEEEEEKSVTTTKASTTTQTTKKTTTTKSAPTTARKTTAPFTTVAYKPVDLFGSTAAATTKKAGSASTKTKKAKKTTPKSKRSDNSSYVKNLTSDIQADIKDEQDEYSPNVLEEAADAEAPADIGSVENEDTASVNEELDSYMETSRKKTIGIAAASALLSAAVIDVMITGGFRKKRKSEDITKEEEAD